MLSIERESQVDYYHVSDDKTENLLGTLRRLINSAERSLAALAERDSILALQSQRQGEPSTGGPQGTPLSSSSRTDSSTSIEEDNGVVQEMRNVHL